MTHKKKSEFVTALDTWSDISKHFTGPVLEKGGNDYLFRGIPFNEGLANDIAELVIERGLYRILVDYDKNCEELAQSAKSFGALGIHVREEDFSWDQVGKRKTELMLFCFGKKLYEKDATQRVVATGFQPAIFPELIAFGKRRAEFLKTHRVVALGSRVYVGEDRGGIKSSPCFSPDNECCDFILTTTHPSSDSVFSTGTYFLGARRRPK
ncbi:hypothetical protein KJ969_02145 [Patescibacteria group bacterium]|nr:hypothetical protein [Patescibacteria group bacterium]MBU1922244.1 hypothetical protein [Patescibacteria group bacterium]